MYRNYFGLRQKPFSIAPDPAFLYMSERHREALAHLLYGIRSDAGFVLLTGEVGTGKTTICRCLLEQMPESARVAYIINPRLSTLELLVSICEEFGIACPPEGASGKLLVDLINEYLLKAHAEGCKPVLIIDEAQNLSHDLLEQIRLLTNLETNEQKLLLIIMLGQPELRDKLLRPELRQMQQRITARYHLGPLSKSDTCAYVNHRLAVAGSRRRLFTSAALSRVFAFSGGVPRLINLLCDRSLLGAYSKGDTKVNRAIVGRAAGELLNDGRRRFGDAAVWRPWALAAVLLITVLAGFHYGAFPGLSGADFRPLLKRFLPASVSRSFRPPPAPAPECLASHSAAGDLVKAVKKSKKSILPLISRAAGPAAGGGRPRAETVPLRWPAAKSRAKSKILAFRALFKQWGLNYDPGRYPVACNQARAEGADCLYRQGNWGGLRRLNRPAVLRFIDEAGGEYYAALSAIAGDSATLSVGGRQEVVRVEELEKYWTGTYIVLWRTPPAYSGALLPGHGAPWLSWLGTRLAAVSGQPDSSSKVPAVLTGKLLARVKDFQRQRGLKADGILGPQTLINLNSLTARVPTLIKSVKRISPLASFENTDSP
ncbi:AAA family ATPase [Desulfobacterota bacterium M19]